MKGKPAITIGNNSNMINTLRHWDAKQSRAEQSMSDWYMLYYLANWINEGARYKTV